MVNLRLFLVLVVYVVDVLSERTEWSYDRRINWTEVWILRTLMKADRNLDEIKLYKMGLADELT